MAQLVECFACLKSMRSELRSPEPTHIKSGTLRIICNPSDGKVRGRSWGSLEAPRAS